MPSDFIEMLGGWGSIHLQQSQRAVAAAGSSAAAPDAEERYASQEYTCSSYALLSLVTWWSCRRRLHRDKLRGICCLGAILSGLLDGEDSAVSFPDLQTRPSVPV